MTDEDVLDAIARWRMNITFSGTEIRVSCLTPWTLVIVEEPIGAWPTSAVLMRYVVHKVLHEINEGRPE